MENVQVTFKDLQTDKEIILTFKSEKDSDSIDLNVNLEKINLKEAINKEALIASMFGLFMEMLENNSGSMSIEDFETT
jgi:hypothetical protein